MTATKHILDLINKKKQEGYKLSNPEILKIVEATSLIAKNHETHKVFKHVYTQINNNQKTFTSLLTRRELEVLELIGILNNSEAISKTLNIKLSTVETHRKNIRRKLTIKGNNQLYNYAMMASIIKSI